MLQIQCTQQLAPKPLCHLDCTIVSEPRRQKTGLRCFRPRPTQIRMRRLSKWLEAWNFVFRKERDCTIGVAKTKALISFAVTTKLICVFVFAYAKIRFSHVAAHLVLNHLCHQNSSINKLQIYSLIPIVLPLSDSENDMIIISLYWQGS